MSWKLSTVATGIVLMLLSGGTIQAATPATSGPGVAAATQPETVYRNLAQAFANMYSSRYRTRQKSLREFQTILIQSTIVALEQAPVEQRIRLIQMLHFMGGLSDWSRYAMRMPAARRKRFLKWAEHSGMLPETMEVFSNDAKQRIAAARALAKCPGKQADRLLGRLIADADLRVLMATMDATWDRKNVVAPARALWQRFIDPGSQAVANRSAIFRGQRMMLYYPGNSMRYQIAPWVTQELCHWKSPAIKKRLVNYINQSATSGGVPGQWFSSVFNGTGRQIVELFAVYKPVKAAPALLRMVRQPVYFPQTFQTQMAQAPFFGNGMRMVYADSRTEALSMLILAAGKKPHQYGMVWAPMGMMNDTQGGIWTCRSAAQENAIIKKVMAYWKAHR